MSPGGRQGGGRLAAPRIELRIERLLLDGLLLDDRHRGAVRLAVEAELTRLLGDGGLARRLSGDGGGVWGRLQAGDVQLVPGGGPADIGRRIAGAVYQGIAGPPARPGRRA
jgi:hypothetical protein